jgi:rod shape-determining protein MreC
MKVRRRRSGRWIPAVLIAAVGLFFLFPQTRNRPLSLVEAPFVWTASQLTRTVRGVTDSIHGTWNDYAALKGVREQLKDVEGQRDHLLVALSDSWEQAARADHLARLLELKKRVNRPAVAARVLGTDSSHWFRALLVDRGEFDGVAAGDGVMVPEGVVGRVAKVTHTTAQVLSVHNRGSVIPARVQRSRHAGILVGGVRPSAVADLKDTGGDPLPPPEVLMELQYVQRNADVVVGDTVVTSGLEGRFPPGIPIGKVVRVVRSNAETFLKVYVVPVLPFGAVEDVLVLTGEPRPMEEP